MIWYRMGKPIASVLLENIPNNYNGQKPVQTVLSAWMTDWGERALSLDEQVNFQLDKRLVEEKVEMLRRHTRVAENMQDLAVQQFERHEEDTDYIPASTALRMLTEGIRIERESRGIPGMLEKLANKDDDGILDDIKKLVKKSVEAKQDDISIIDLEVSDVEDSGTEDSELENSD